VTYRDPDPDRQAASEAQLAADEQIEDAAALGREARSRHEAGIEKRLLRKPPSGKGAAFAPWGLGLGAYMSAIVSGLTVPIGLGVGFGALAISALGMSALDQLRLRRERAWAMRQEFAVLGYVEVLSSRLVVAAITAKITLASIEDEDRERVIDLLGRLDTVDPVVTVEANTIRIELLISGSAKRFMRDLIDHVARALHQARQVVVVELAASTADPAKPYDLYR